MISFRVLQVLLIAVGFYTWTLIGQAVLFLFVGSQGDRNVVYRLFRQINFPVVWVTRRITPRFVADFHIGFVAFALLIVLRVLIYVLFYRAGAVPTITPTGG
ncbi:MAG TPA: hypothetical protein VKB51_12155 [bacterium]|nr:hypothetical protein [bacterium]